MIFHFVLMLQRNYDLLHFYAQFFKAPVSLSLSFHYAFLLNAVIYFMLQYVLVALLLMCRHSLVTWHYLHAGEREG